jgi:hypothetical protein
VAAEYRAPPYGLSIDHWGLEALLNLTPDNLNDIQDRYPVPSGRRELLEFARKLQRTARVLRSPPCPVPWPAYQRRRDLEHIVETLPRPPAWDKEAEITDFLLQEALREAYPTALTVLDESPLWAEVRDRYGVQAYRWLASAEDTLRGMLRSNADLLTARLMGKPWEPRWYEARECLWCHRLLIAELGGKGRPREYCRPSHRVRAREAGV